MLHLVTSTVRDIQAAGGEPVRSRRQIGDVRKGIVSRHGGCVIGGEAHGIPYIYDLRSLEMPRPLIRVPPEGTTGPCEQVGCNACLCVPLSIIGVTEDFYREVHHGPNTGSYKTHRIWRGPFTIKTPIGIISGQHTFYIHRRISYTARGIFFVKIDHDAILKTTKTICDPKDLYVIWTICITTIIHKRFGGIIISIHI